MLAGYLLQANCAVCKNCYLEIDQKEGKSSKGCTNVGKALKKYHGMREIFFILGRIGKNKCHQ